MKAKSLHKLWGSLQLHSLHIKLGFPSGSTKGNQEVSKTFLLSKHFFGFTQNLYEKVSTDHSICDLTEQIRRVIAFVSMLFFPLQYKEAWNDCCCDINVSPDRDFSPYLACSSLLI